MAQWVRYGVERDMSHDMSFHVFTRILAKSRPIRRRGRPDANKISCERSAPAAHAHGELELNLIGKLKGLVDAGAITESDFVAKRAELLARI